MEKFYTETELADLIDIKPKTLQRWRMDNIGPRFLRIGRRAIRYPANDLVSWLNSQSSGGDSVEVGG